MSYIKTLALACALATVAASLAGCPFSAPSVQNALLVKPDTLDFGTDSIELTFEVAKTWSSRPIPPFAVSPSASWISVSPTSGGTTAPWDRAVITVTIDRSKLTAFQNQANVTVSAGNVVPVSVRILAQQVFLANFTADKTLVGFNNPVQFTDLSVSSSPVEIPITTWEWDFGDGTTSTERNPSHTYTAEGAYTVSLTVGDGTRSHTAIKPAFIVLRDIVPPAADFSASVTKAMTGQQIQFTDLTVASPANPVTAWMWDFGDGSAGINRTQQNPVHIYNAPGLYTVSLMVTAGPFDDTEEKTDYIQVALVDFTADKTIITANESVQFTDISAVPGETIQSWAWDFGDGNTGAGPMPLHTYTAAASMYTYYPVSMSIQTDQSSVFDRVKPNLIKLYTPGAPGKAGAAAEAVSAPVAACRVLYPWNAPFKWFVTGQDVAFDSDSDTGGPGLVSYAWDFGDGGSSPAKAPFHAYAAEGTHAVSLSVTNGAGTDTAVCPDTVHVFEAGALDDIARRFDPRFRGEPRITGSIVDEGITVTQAEFTSQMSGDADDAQALVHRIAVMRPDHPQTQAVLLILAGAAADEVALARAALETGQTVAILYPAVGLEQDTQQAVRAAVAAMNALDHLGAGAGAGYTVAGAGDAAWTALLAAGVDQRVCAVVTSGMSAEAPAGIDDAARYAARVQIPVEDAAAVLAGVDGFPVTLTPALAAGLAE
jgi:PKD repeat protein